MALWFDHHEIVVLNGVTTTVKVAHLRLCHSRMMFVLAYPRETQERVFDADQRARPKPWRAPAAGRGHATSESAGRASWAIAAPLSMSKMRTASAGMTMESCDPGRACVSRPPTATTEQPRTWKPT